MSPSRALSFAAGAAAATGYVWAMVRRNRSLVPPPVRDSSGNPLPEKKFTHSDGATVSFLDVGPTGRAGRRQPSGEEPEAHAGEDEAGGFGTGGREAPPMLLVPGADGVKESYRYQIPRFSRRFRVLAPDLRSEFPEDADFDLFRRDLLELMEALDTGPVILVGQSLGGAISMRFAARHPDRVRALVLCNTLYRVSYEHLGLNRAALIPLAVLSVRYLPTPLGRAAARMWSRSEVWIFDDSPGRENVVEYALWTGARTVSPRVGGFRVDLLRGLDLRPELAEIRAPTLVVKGPRDVFCPPEWSHEIAASIPGAAYVEIPGTGHCSHISMPGRFNRAVEDWLRGAVLAGSF